MRADLQIIQQIESYLMGTMSAPEKVVFEQKIQSDAHLKNLVDWQQQIVEGIRYRGLKTATQKAYKSFRLQQVLIKAVIVGVVLGAVTLAALYLLATNSENSSAPEYNETQKQVVFPENDSLSAEANHYLEQEIFTVSTQHDTLIETRDGLVLYIPESAFHTNAESVDLLVQTALRVEDILVSGLSTVTAQGEMLETGGMFYVDAYVNNQRVDLKKAITASIPTNEIKAGMQLYDGEKNANGEIVWNNPKPLEKFLTPTDITKLDFYPPGYEKKMNDLGYCDKGFLDSVYYSFGCEENKLAARVDWDDTDGIMLGENLFSSYCASCHLPNQDLTGPSLVGSRQRWINRSSEENFYAYIKNSSAVVNSGDSYAIELREKWKTIMTPQPLNNFMIDKIINYVEWFDASNGGTEDGVSPMDIIKSYCPGINPASIKAIWNEKFNGTNLATSEFEERMPWIHQSCNNTVLELYINNLDKSLSAVDSMALPYLSGGVLQKFRYFASRGDGRVELDNPASQKLAAYFEKQRDAEAKALAETQQNFWKEQSQLDAQNTQLATESMKRDAENQADVFKKEFQKNLCKVYDELDVPKDCNAPPVQNNLTVQVGTLGWKNLDRLVWDATAARETTTFSENGKTSTLTYNLWSATIADFSTYARIHVYNIPVEFNSYVKLNGTNGKYEYKLNADIDYQTVVLAWTENAIHFFKASAVPGESNIALRPISDEEWRTEIRNSLTPIKGMTAEMDYVKHMQKDQKRINQNQEKLLLRQKIEPVVFPCEAVADSSSNVISPH